MKVLVTWASKHGSTAEIGYAIGGALRRQRERLLGAPVWLYSSGPLGREARPRDAPVDRNELSFAERAIGAALHAPDGDFRDWEEIRGWAHEIAGALQRKEVRA